MGQTPLGTASKCAAAPSKPRPGTPRCWCNPGRRIRRSSRRLQGPKVEFLFDLNALNRKQANGPAVCWQRACGGMRTRSALPDRGQGCACTVRLEEPSLGRGTKAELITGRSGRVTPCAAPQRHLCRTSKRIRAQNGTARQRQGSRSGRDILEICLAMQPTCCEADAVQLEAFRLLAVAALEVGRIYRRLIDPCLVVSIPRATVACKSRS